MDIVTAIVTGLAGIVLVIYLANRWGWLGESAKSVLLFLRKTPHGLPKTGPSSGAKPVSDDNFRFLQLVHIFTGLVPKILLDVLTHHIALNKAFQERFDKKPWDGGEEHRKWLATVMEENPQVQDFSCKAVRNKLTKDLDVTNLSAALSAVMEPLDVPCDVTVTQACTKSNPPKAIDYFKVDVSALGRSDFKTWEGFSINVTGASGVVECTVTEAPSDTQVVAVCRAKAKDHDLPKKIKKYMAAGARPVYLPLPEVQDIVQVRRLRNTLYHGAEVEVSDEKFTQCVASVQRLIEQALRPEEDSDGYLAKLEDTADTERFKEWICNGRNAAESKQMLEHAMEDLQELGEQGEKLREKIEDLSRNLEGILRSLEHGQEKLLSGQEDIQRRQEEQHAVVMDKLEKLEDGQKDDTVLLSWKPPLMLLRNIVVPKVSANWKTVGLNLDIKDSCLSAIEKSKPNQTEACTEMFSMWLGLAPHTGGLPLTWSSVLSAIEKVDRVTSEELKSFMEAHPATLKLAGELEAFYKRLEPVVGDNDSPTVEFLQLAAVERQKRGLKNKKDQEDFLHATVYGIDEIYQKSHPVEYCQILTLEKGPTSSKHIIISGAPGSGKSTLVRQLCKDLSSGSLPNDYTLVVLVELRELILLLQDKEEAQLHHFLAKFKRRVDVDQVCKELEKSCGKSVLLVLDGFDELDAKMRGCQLLKELLSTERNYLPDCDILITSRPVTCPDLLGLMQPLHRHIEILGFSEDRIASYVRSYFKCTCQPPPPSSKPPPSQSPPFQPLPSQKSAGGGCEAEKLLSRLDQLPQVKGMCRTPVVLKIVCKVCELLGADSLPMTMTGIYEKFLLHNINASQGTEASSILQVPRSDPLFNDLCRIAFDCCTEQKLIISRHDISNIQPQFSRGSIYGLLNEDRVEDVAIPKLTLYHFLHKTVQEALAACHVAVLPNPKSHVEEWKKSFGRPEMAEVWKFYCGLTKLENVDISSIVPLADEADWDVHTLLVISLFEAGNASLAIEELPRIFPSQLVVELRTPYETAAYAFALQHHPSLESLHLVVMTSTGSVNLQLLLDALSHPPTARELYVDGLDMTAKDRPALCQFLRGKHRLAKVALINTPVEVVVAALSTESSTMEELEWLSTIRRDAPDDLPDCLRSTSLRHITIEGAVGKMLLPILRGLTANTNTVDRTVVCFDSFPLDPPSVSQLAELSQFLVPCVNCYLSVPLPVGVWGTLLSGVGDARRLEWLRVGMRDKPRGAGPEWDHIDQTTLEEVEKSWAHSRCREVKFGITGVGHVRGGTLDATIKLLCAAVRGIIQREDPFVFELKVNDEQVRRLVEFEEMAMSKCAVTKRKENRFTILELVPHCEAPPDGRHAQDEEGQHQREGPTAAEKGRQSETGPLQQ